MDVLQTHKVLLLVTKAFSCSLYMHSYLHRKNNSGFLHLRGKHRRHAALYWHFQNQTGQCWNGQFLPVQRKYLGGKYRSILQKYQFTIIFFFNWCSTTKELYKLSVGQWWTSHVKPMQCQNPSNSSASFKYQIFSYKTFFSTHTYTNKTFLLNLARRCCQNTSFSRCYGLTDALIWKTAPVPVRKHSSGIRSRGPVMFSLLLLGSLIKRGWFKSLMTSLYCCIRNIYCMWAYS